MTETTLIFDDGPVYGPLATPEGYRQWVRDDEPVVGGPTQAPLPTAGPLISVVVPVYRPLPWSFQRCLESVMAQRYTNWELCLCDDHSGDDELSPVFEALAGDPRIKVVVHRENRGISEASNSALSLATGEFVALLDHDDLLHPDALSEVAVAFGRHLDADVVYTDADRVDGDDQRYDPHLKPDWAPDLLLAQPYLGHLLTIRRSLLLEIGGFRSEFDGSQDFDVMLRATERARRVVHVPRVLYHWRAVTGSVALDPHAKPWAHEASRSVVTDAVARRGLDARVEDGPSRGTYHVRRAIPGNPPVSVIVAGTTLAAGLAALAEQAGYPHFEMVLIDEGTGESSRAAAELRARLADTAVEVVEVSPGTPLAHQFNAAARSRNSEILVFTSGILSARRPGWLRALVELAVREDVGTVGARLLYDNGRIRHAGMVLGLFGVAARLYEGLEADYMPWTQVVRPYSAVSAECLATRRRIFEDLGGFDEALERAYFDVDYCLRVGESGLWNLYTPLAELVSSAQDRNRSVLDEEDAGYLLDKWGRDRIFADPFYNPLLSLFASNFSLRSRGDIGWWRDRLAALGR
jgi:GT2 family glycosyltransferase